MVSASEFMQFKGPVLQFALCWGNLWVGALCPCWVKKDGQEQECWPGTLSVRFKKHCYFSPRAEVQVLKAVQSVCLHSTEPQACLSLLMDLSSFFYAFGIWSTMVCAVFWGKRREKETAGARAEREPFHLALPSDHKKYRFLALKHESMAKQCKFFQ